MLSKLFINTLSLFLVVLFVNLVQAIRLDKSTKSYSVKPNKIIGGISTQWSNYPSLVSLLNNGRHFCGGALLNSDTILTAAHCSNVNINSVSVKVYAGNVNEIVKRDLNNQTKVHKPKKIVQQAKIQGNGKQVNDNSPLIKINLQPSSNSIYNGPDGAYTLHKVQTIFIHPKYQPRGYLKYDVAIWKLSTPVSPRTFYQIDTQSHSHIGGHARFAGWGRVDIEDVNKLAYRLQEIVLPIYPFEKCNLAYEMLIKEHHLCAGDHAAICQGDSGGPLLIGNTIIGVASFVKDIHCFKPGYPSVFARVYTYAQWILQFV